MWFCYLKLKVKDLEIQEHNIRYAGLWIRLMAHNIDLTILLPFFYLLMYFIEINWLLYSIIAFVVISYEVSFVASKWAGTPGKRILHLKVTKNGSNLTYTQSLIRTFCKMLSSLTFFVGFIVIALDLKKRALHDFIMRSNVIFS